MRKLTEKKLQRAERQLAEEKERCARHCRRRSKVEEEPSDVNEELEKLRR